MDVSVSDYKTKIEEFQNGISIKNCKYHVELPWTESVSEVRSNFHVVLAVLNRGGEDLKAKDLYKAYEKVLTQQFNDGIIEQIPLDKINIYDRVRIPHRPVLEEDPQVTTKLRIVLNCSLKVQNTPSLNEASYSGINLLNEAAIANSSSQKPFLHDCRRQSGIS